MRNLKTVNYDEMFTLSAPSPKWVWNAQGQLVEIPAGQPAFGYDRFTGEPLGQIIESVEATNVLLNSFAPATQTVSVSDATTYTLSVYGSGSAEITAGGSGTATDGSPLTFTTTGTSVTVTVTGTLDVFQLENGGAATSPIETTGSAVTRAADVATIENVDTAEWFNPDEWSIFLDATLSDSDDFQWVFSAQNASNVRGVQISNIYIRIREDDGTTIANADLINTGRHKYAFIAKSGTFKIFRDGLLVTSGSGSMPTILSFYWFGAVSQPLGAGVVAETQVFLQAKTDEEAIARTTL